MRRWAALLILGASTVLAAFVGAGVAVLAALAAGVASSVPRIPQQVGARPVAQYVGHPAVAKPVFAPVVPQNPFLSSNPFSNAHDDTYMSDTYLERGPLGRHPVVFSVRLSSRTYPVALGGLMTFDRAGRIVASLVRVSLAMRMVAPQIVLVDPKTLREVAAFDLPEEKLSGSPGTGTFRPSGSYFYQDGRDRTITGTAERTVLVLSHTARSFRLTRKYDLRGVIPQGDSLQALQPDFAGRVWFTSKGGVVGTLDLRSGKVLGIYHMPAGELIVNSHASDETGGVFIVSSEAMYRFEADRGGAPVVSWREPYDTGRRVKPGQLELGSGTTPTLMGKQYVTITDNADPRMQVLVYRRAKHIRGSRLVCSVPVFQSGKSATENSLIATDRSIIVENNYGYSGVAATRGGHTTTPGITRIDINAKGHCRKVWANDQVNIPTVVTKMSISNGLIYTYSKPVGPGTTDRWCFTAIDFRTGKVIYSQLAGTGLLYNNNYEPLYLGPNGTVYVGVFGGFVAMRDTR